MSCTLAVRWCLRAGVMDGVFAGVGKSDDGLRSEEVGSRVSWTSQLSVLLLSALRGVKAPTCIGELGGESTSFRVNAGFALKLELSGGTLL